MTAAVLRAEVKPFDFDDFYREQWPAARRLATSVSGSSAVGEDIAQDVFQRMFCSWGTKSEPAAYLRAAIVNGCRSYHRKCRTERLRLPALAPRGTDTEPAGELDDVVAALPARQRTVLSLRYWDGFSETEIADVLGCEKGTVKSLAARAKERLAVALS
jgi:RNA polymerase sigma factor (sigma-70 family)